MSDLLSLDQLIDHMTKVFSAMVAALSHDEVMDIAWRAYRFDSHPNHQRLAAGLILSDRHLKVQRQRGLT